MFSSQRKFTFLEIVNFMYMIYNFFDAIESKLLWFVVYYLLTAMASIEKRTLIRKNADAHKT